jgi:hypothetical protein
MDNITTVIFLHEGDPRSSMSQIFNSTTAARYYVVAISSKRHEHERKGTVQPGTFSFRLKEKFLPRKFH